MTTPRGRPRAPLRDDLARGSVPYADEARIGTARAAYVDVAADGATPRGHRSGALRPEEL